MDVRISPSKLKGETVAPPSKSYLIRALIIGALYSDKTEIKVKSQNLPEDVIKTIDALNVLGAKVDVKEDKITVCKLKHDEKLKTVDAGECGALIRFLIPVVVAQKLKVKFIGEKALEKRPIQKLFLETGVSFSDDKFPFSVSGKLKEKIEVSGEKSSQHISGLLIAMASSGGKIKVTDKINSQPYIDLTVSLLKKFGVKITKKENEYQVEKAQDKGKIKLVAEGDYSSSAFYFLENALGSEIDIKGLNKKTKQGDKAIEELASLLKLGITIDASNIPDLVPLLCGAGAILNVDTEIINVERLKLKESDRIQAVIKLVKKFGGEIKYSKNKITVIGGKELKGCKLKNINDHRIIETACLMGLHASGETLIYGADKISKSYPNFFEDVKTIGGKIDVYRR